MGEAIGAATEVAVPNARMLRMVGGDALSGTGKSASAAVEAMTAAGGDGTREPDVLAWLEIEARREKEMEDKISGRGHLPLLWVLGPLLAGLAFCLTLDLHAPFVGMGLAVAGGIIAAWLAWRGSNVSREAKAANGQNAPGDSRWRNTAWGAAFCAGGVGLAMVLFAARVAPLPERGDLPPREADLVLRWEQVFAARPKARTTGGIARVLEAPKLLPEMVGTDVYCSLGNPVPPELLRKGAVFRARGVLDTTSHFARESRRRMEAQRERELGRIAAAQQSSTFAGQEDFALPVPVADSRSDGFSVYLERRRAVSAFTRGRVLEVVSEPPLVVGWCAAQRERLSGVLARGLETHPETAALYSAILLGQTAKLERSVRNDFSRTGTAHLFSVSGLHVGVIAAVLFWLGRRLRVPGTPCRLVVITVMLAFVMITGASPPALRAWVMISCMLAAQFFLRRGGSGAGLVLAATGTLLWKPTLLLDAGFQLSYGIVASLIFFGLPLSQFLRARWNPWRDLPPRGLGWSQRAVLWFLSWLAGGIGVGASSMLVGAPLVLYHFSLFSAGSIFANLVVVPLSFPVMVLGFVSVLLGVCGVDTLAVPLNWLAGLDLRLVHGVVEWLSGIPGMALSLEYRVSWAGPATAGVLLLLLLFLPSPGRSRVWLLLVPPAFLALSLLAFTKFL